MALHHSQNPAGEFSGFRVGLYDPTSSVLFIKKDDRLNSGNNLRILIHEIGEQT